MSSSPRQLPLSLSYPRNRRSNPVLSVSNDSAETPVDCVRLALPGGKPVNTRRGMGAGERGEREAGHAPVIGVQQKATDCNDFGAATCTAAGHRHDHVHPSGSEDNGCRWASKPKRIMRKLPAWWGWELELSLHLLKRMNDRDFTEIDIRHILNSATSIRRDVVSGRWVAATRLRGRRWDVIVEPDPDVQLLFVITAYPV